MIRIIYYAAVSVDGFIARTGGDISGFVNSGSGVDKYLQDLSLYETVIMGRSTYEFGYEYGLKPGQPAYEHMDHYIFSKSLTFDKQSPKVNIISAYDLAEIDKIKAQAKTDIYLCGGGVFAGWLLDHGYIDILKLKCNALIIGEGAPLFAEAKQQYKLELLESESFDKGLIINTYQVNYDKP